MTPTPKLKQARMKHKPKRRVKTETMFGMICRSLLALVLGGLALAMFWAWKMCSIVGHYKRNVD
jgi:hypothetical protein